MRFDDLKKLFTGPVLIRLDRIITPKLITLFYLSGLAGIGLLGMNHLFFSFRYGLGNGLWGVLEIAIFGTLAFIALRAICEFALIYFETHKDVVARFSQSRVMSAAPTLIEEVQEAIEDLARDDAEHNDTAQNAVPDATRVEQTSAAKTTPQSTRARQSQGKTATGKTPKRASPRRTAKRAPKSSRS